MERIVYETVYGFSAHLCAHDVEAGDERFYISQVGRGDERIRIFRTPFVGYQLCLS